MTKISFLENQSFDCIVIGGGASGFFYALNYAELNPDCSILILEKSKNFLSKVKISGGGRCNVTHAVFEPKPLTKHYPRGEKELISPFHKFMTGDMMGWLEERGVPLKIEEDGRVFPTSDSSQSIIDCFLNESKRLGVQMKTSQVVIDFEFSNDRWIISTKQEKFKAKTLVISTGSSAKIWNLLSQKGHQVVNPIPSLFTFNIKHQRLTQLQGLSLETKVDVFEEANSAKVILSSEGATLITHWGLSGPCVLKLSAWGAELLNAQNYNFLIKVNWLPNYTEAEIVSVLKEQKNKTQKRQLSTQIPFEIPKRLWLFFIEEAGVDGQKNWADASNNDFNKLARCMSALRLKVEGKSTFKDEFVTAGGVDLKEIDFKTYSSKQLPQLKIIGEALNIDAITGGFNFQNAWTSAYIAAINS